MCHLLHSRDFKQYPGSLLMSFNFNFILFIYLLYFILFYLFFIYLFIFSIKIVESGVKNRVGRVSGNTAMF